MAKMPSTFPIVERIGSDQHAPNFALLASSL
jgi:hypothetical protein